jgi:hypothetical protein
MAITTQPLNTCISFDDGDCQILYPARSTNTYQMISKMYPNSVLEIMIENNTCILTVMRKHNVLAFTSFNIITLRVAPTGCPLDNINMAIVRDDLYNKN